MMTDSFLLITVPIVFFVDLFMTFFYKNETLERTVFYQLFRFLMLVVGIGFSWVLFFDVPSKGEFYDYLVMIPLIYFVFYRMIFRR